MPADSLRDTAFCDVLNRELVCALGCTEPIAVAYAAALASQTLGCEPDHMDVACSGNIIKNAHYKLAADYDPTKQNDYIERKYRPEWSYVGMVGVIPVRDDGTCEAGCFCKCGQNGIATRAESRGFDTFFVIERISDNVVTVEMR